MNQQGIASESRAVQDEQMAARVAWLYFVEGWTQSEIAESLATNRLRINRILNEARRSGLVSFTLNSKLASCAELEQRLIRELGLKDAIIVPTPRDEAQVRGIIGQATAGFIARLLAAGRLGGIATSWGVTIREVVRNLPPMAWPELMVCSALGGLTRGLEINTFDISAAFARRLGAQCTYFAAPLHVDSAETRDRLLGREPFSSTLAQVAACDLILVSIGDMSERSLFVRYGLPADVSAEDLVAAGASGDLMGHLIDRRGRALDHPLNHRCMTLPLERMRAIPYAVAACGGLHKAEVLAGVLAAGWCNVLVCDEKTARAALDLAAGLQK